MVAPTRRSILGAVSVAALPAPVMALPVPETIDDNSLLRLIAAYEAALVTVDKADEALSQAHQRFAATRPPVPDVMMIQPLDRHYGWVRANSRPNYIGNLNHVKRIHEYYETMAATYGQANVHAERGFALIAAIETYEEGVDRARAACGLAEGVQSYDHARGEEEAVLRAILDYRPRTLSGLHAKCKIAARFIGEQDELGSFSTQWAQALLADTIALGSA